MTVADILTYMYIWNLCGAAIDTTWCTYSEIEGLELYNPKQAYHHYTRCNWFGAILISLIFTIICPVGAVVYWVLKLFTTKRK